jgi:hypothetical protein
MSCKFAWLLWIIPFSIHAQSNNIPGMSAPKQHDTVDIQIYQTPIHVIRGSSHTYYMTKPQIIVSPYTLGLFCKFEDYINQDRKFRIDFGTD